MADGIKIKIRADIREAEKAMAAVEKQAAKVKDLEKEWAGLKKEYDAAGKAAAKAAADVDKAFAKLQDAQREQAAIAASLKEQFNLGGGIDTSAAYEAALANNRDYQKASAEVARLRATLGQLHEQMSNAEVDQGNLADRVRTAEQSVAQERQELGRLSERAREANATVEKIDATFAKVKNGALSLLSGIRRLTKKGFEALGKRFTGGEKSANKFTKAIIKLGTMLKLMVIRKALSAMLTGAREGFENLAQYSTECNANISALISSLTRLKNSFATAFAPILSVVTPALTALIDKLSTAVTYVGMLFAALSGAKSFTRAAAVTEDYAASLGDASTAAEEAKKTFSFDTLNQMNGSNSSQGAGAGGVSPSEMFEEVQIPSWIQEISDLIKGHDWEGLGRYAADGINRGLAALKDLISWDNVGDALTTIVNGITGTINSLVDNIDWALMGATLGTGVNTLVNTLYLLFTGINWYNIGAALATGLNSMIATIDWYHLGETITAYFMIAVQTALGFVQTFDWASAGAALAVLLQGLISGIDWASIGALLGDAVIGVLTFLYTAIETFDWGGLGTYLWNALVAFISSVNWAGLISSAFELLGAALGAAPALIVSFAQSLWEALKGAFEGTKAYFQEYITAAGGDVIAGLLNGIWDAMKSIGSWIYSHIFQPFIDGFKSAFGIASPSTVMMEMGGFIIDGLKAGLTGLWESIKGIFTGAIDNIKNIFSLDTLTEIGANAVSGLMNGLKSIGSKAVEWGKGILGNIKDALGIHSPSTETEAVGKYTVSGYINGLNASAPTLQATLTNMANNVIALFKNTANTLFTMQTNAQNNATSSLTAWIASVTAIQTNAQAASTSSVNSWMTTVRGLFTNFFADLNAQADAWAVSLQATLDRMVAAAQAAARAIAAAMSSGSSSKSSSSSSKTTTTKTKTSSVRSVAAQIAASKAATVTVPAYATGKVLPANHPHLAIVGDQRKGTSIETQISTMVTAFKRALSETGGAGGNRPLQVDLYLDSGVRLGRALLPSIEAASGSRSVSMTVKGV